MEHLPRDIAFELFGADARPQLHDEDRVDELILRFDPTKTKEELADERKRRKPKDIEIDLYEKMIKPPLNEKIKETDLYKLLNNNKVLECSQELVDTTKAVHFAVKERQVAHLKESNELAKKKERIATSKMNMSLTNLQYSCGYKERPDENGKKAAAAGGAKSPKGRGAGVRASSEMGKSSQ